MSSWSTGGLPGMSPGSFSPRSAGFSTERCSTGTGGGPEAVSAVGARVAVCARNEETLSRAAEEIAAKTGNPVLPVRADLTRNEEIDALFARIGSEFGTLHILVNNVGGPHPSGFLGASGELRVRSLHLNFLSAIR